MPLYYCVAERKPCVRWVDKYFKDCLCNLRDDLSFGFGLVSLVCWGVADIPQIITNYQTKSSHSVSLAFLLTWVAGDVLNLTGCLLEPATLPTQYYTALLYTTSTVVLLLQSVYYDYFYTWWKCGKVIVNQAGEEESYKKPLNPKLADSGVPIPSASPKATPRREFYYTVYGQWLGWLMAAIYMGGPLPQIWLNIKRGSVEGLNPLIFVFALTANVTYVASILVRTTEWDKLKANMPWLLDAVVGVALDLFVSFVVRAKITSFC